MGSHNLKSGTAWLATASGVLCIGAIISVVSSPSPLLTAAGDLIQSFLLLSLFLAVVGNVRACYRPVRIFWLFMSVAMGMWCSAQILWTYFEVILRKEVPNPFVGDIAIVLHLVPIVAALAIRPDREREGSPLRSMDFILLFSWWLYLYLFFVIPWQYVSPSSFNYGFNFDVLYFAGHMVVLLAAADAWHNSIGIWRAVYGQILLASVVYALASIAASVAIDFGKYYTGSFYDLPLLMSVILFTRMALAGRQTRSPMDLAPAPAQWAHPWITTLAIGAASSLPLLVAWAVFVSDAPATVRQYRLAVTLAMIVFAGGLRSIKQYTLHRELAHANQELREAALTDTLTGVRNRRFLATFVEKDSQQAIRFYSRGGSMNRNRDLIFYLIDIDQFKLVNDQFGHEQGDALLVQVAARISSSIRHSDVLMRWGGEEFLVVSRFTDREDAAILATRVLQAIGTDLFQLSSGSVRRTCSIGWAVFPWLAEYPGAICYQDVLRLADQALYKAKNSGRNMAVGLIPEVAGCYSEKPDRALGHLPDEGLPVKTVITKGAS